MYRNPCRFSGDVRLLLAVNKPMLQHFINVLIFPNLDAANISYKMMKELYGAESIGPIMMGMKKPAHVLQLGSSVDEMVNMAAIAVIDAQNKAKNPLCINKYEK